ncbi:MAG: MerR family transcriptional regulator [Deltaproteobacteria bacterium]|nr:MerR family transcriptional regulator [Deltaproteobacteria bacterium]
MSYIKIKELSEATGLPASTIRYYVREGLLHPPVKTGKTMAYYDESHVRRLELIKEIQNGEKLPLRFLKRTIEKMEHEHMDVLSGPEKTSSRRDAIMRAAISLFREKGYENTSIGDIVDLARAGRGTFYLHFNNKEELFIECADKIFFAMYDDVWQEIKDEKNMLERIKKRGNAFYRSYPQWKDMMNLIRGAAVGRGPFAEKLEKVMHQIVDPISRDVKKGMDQGTFRPFDRRIVAFMLMGIAEYISYLLHEDPSFNPDDVYETMWDIIQHGLGRRGAGGLS